MKLLFLQETDWIKRYPAQQHHLAEMMSLRGHEVLAIDFELSWRTNGDKELYSKRIIFQGVSKIHPESRVTIIRPGFVKLPWLDYISMGFSHWREIKRQIKEFQPDAIIGFGIINSCSAIRLVHRTKIPFIIYWIDVLHLLIPHRSLRALGKSLESYALKRSDMALAINECLNELMIKLGSPVGQTYLLRAGIDVDKFNYRMDGNKTRQQYEVSPEDRVLFFMGFLYQFSGLKEVAQRIATLGDKHLKLLVVGEGDAYEELKAIRDKYSLQDNIILTGKKPYQEIPSLIAAADICLLPAYRDEPIMQDIVPIKLYEYMAMQKPVISTRLPGVMKEFGEDNGVVYVDNPEDVIDTAVKLFSNGNVATLGDKARRFAEKNSWNNITDALGQLIKEAINKKND